MASFRFAASVLALAVIVFDQPVYAADLTADYLVTKTIFLGSPEKWDFIHFDATTHRVYVAHDTEIAIVDGEEGKLIGRISGFPGGTHDVAIAASQQKGYTDDGEGGYSASFDLRSLKLLNRIKTAPDSDAIAFDPKTGHVFVLNGDSGTITVVDPPQDKVIAVINVGSSLEMAVADGEGHLYVNAAEKREIVRIDTTSNQINARWSIPDCERPHGLAFDKEAHRLFATCVNAKMLIVSSEDGALVATLPIGKYTDGAAFDPKRKRIYSSNGDGSISVIMAKDAHHYTSLGSIKTPYGSRNISIDPATGRLYLISADLQSLEAPKEPGGRPKPHYVSGSTRLVFLDPQR